MMMSPGACVPARCRTGTTCGRLRKIGHQEAADGSPPNTSDRPRASAGPRAASACRSVAPASSPRRSRRGADQGHRLWRAAASQANAQRAVCAIARSAGRLGHARHQPPTARRRAPPARSLPQQRHARQRSGVSSFPRPAGPYRRAGGTAEIALAWAPRRRAAGRRRRRCGSGRKAWPAAATARSRARGGELAVEADGLAPRAGGRSGTPPEMRTWPDRRATCPCARTPLIQPALDRPRTPR
jgi:hypothetical protein